MQFFFLKKLDKIVDNLSEKEHESLRGTLQRGELLGGSNGNVFKFSFIFY